MKNSVDDVVEHIDDKLRSYESSDLKAMNDVEYGRYKELKKLRQEVAGQSRDAEKKNAEGGASLN